MEDLASYKPQIRIRKIYKILFIFFVVLGLYYPALFSQFNSVDDSHIIQYLEDVKFTLLDILLPGQSHYYRPLLWVTFFFDKHVWGGQPSFMHLENIIIHAVNTIMVFILAAKMAVNEQNRLELPLFAALLFALHPINTEAVCWVAGRTDLLATMFILFAAWYLVGCCTDPGEQKLAYLIPAALIFIGCLAKEVAFFFFPVACIAAIRQSNCCLPSIYPPLRWREYSRILLPFIVFPLLYLYLRQAGLSVQDKSVSILMVQKTTIFTSGFVALKSFGFYFKKLFLPLPLNFAIISYSDNYVWLGAAVVVLLCWLLWQKKTYFFFLGCSIFLILPAVLVAVKTIAWTPVAERYLYAPSAFFTIAVTGIFFSLIDKKTYSCVLPLLLSVLIVVSALLTVQRNLVWQDNYLLYKDTVAKSPGFANIRNEYGIALAERGNGVEALNQFEIGKKLDPKFDLNALNLANIRFKEGKIEEALGMLTKSYKDINNAPVNILKLQARIYEYQLFKTALKSDQQRIYRNLIELYNYIYIKDKDPYVAYRCGQMLLFVNEPGKAAIQFETAFKEAPEGSFYKQAAKKLANKLKANNI